MDNPLTPKRIQRLMYLAEDKSFTTTQKNNLLDENGLNNLNALSAAIQSTSTQSNNNYEASSGILDLERCEAFGDSVSDNVSLCKSTAFNPGEMTGRSTGTADVASHTIPLGPAPSYSEFGRYSVSSIDDFAKKMNQQSSDVSEIMRQSIATTYSFQSRRDLTADEISLMMREGVPVHPSQMNPSMRETTLESDRAELSLGAYFQNRCGSFSRILKRTDSPDYDASDLDINDMPATQLIDKALKENNQFQMDATLDCVPVRQPRMVPNVPAFPKPSPQVQTYKERAVMAAAKSTIPNNIILDPSKQHLYPSLVTVSEESSYESLSTSKIAQYLGESSNLSVSGMLTQLKADTKKPPKKHPLTELNMNTDKLTKSAPNLPVTSLKDTKKTELASTAGSVNTVIDMNKYKDQENAGMVPEVVVSHPSPDHERSKGGSGGSRSYKSQSTVSTVKDNYQAPYCNDLASPPRNDGGVANSSKIPSPNIEYRQLDHSVDWHEVLQAKGQRNRGALGKASGSTAWATVQATPVEGFVGLSSSARVTITSHSDSWLTARLEFHCPPDQEKDFNVVLPRFPILLTPRNTEQFDIQISSNIELATELKFLLFLKDSTTDSEVDVSGCVEVNFKMPIIQAFASDGVNKLKFPPLQQGKALTKSFILISDCAADFQLDLSVIEGRSMFSIYSVQEIKKGDVTKCLLETSVPFDTKSGNSRGKGMTRQLCRLSSGCALRVSLTFFAPKISDFNISGNIATLCGMLTVSLIGINALLKKVELIATVGIPKLSLNLPNNNIHVGSELSTTLVANTGSAPGTWKVYFKDLPDDTEYPFKIFDQVLDINPGSSVKLRLVYNGPEEISTERVLTIEEIYTNATTTINLTAGQDKPKVFPIKTNHGSLSWVRAGRQELSLKNSSDKRVHIRCRIVGDGFAIDLPKSNGQTMLLMFAPCESRRIPVLFTPNTGMPFSATLHLACENESELSRKVRLYGCASESGTRWCGLATYDDSALVLAESRRPLELRLSNRARADRAFVSARVHFNLQYMSVAATSRLEGARRVIPGRGTTTMTLHVDWARVEIKARNAASVSNALATVTVLTGSEFTRLRILRILQGESGGELDRSSLPEHLQQLVGSFEGEDPAMPDMLEDFHEAKTSLDELVSGLQELTAQIRLPQDFVEDNTILITDDTVIDHHTLCD